MALTIKPNGGLNQERVSVSNRVIIFEQTNPHGFE